MREMKDSGMEFVGKIPKNWNVKKTKYIATNISKGNGITKDQVLKDGNIQCVRYGEIYSKYDGIVVDTKSLTKIEEIDSPKYARYGDILFAGTGELIEEIGKNIVYLGNKPCLVGGDIVVMKHNQNPRFLNYALGSFYAQSQKSKGKAKLKVVHISAEEIGNIKIVLPSLKEQELIADFLDSKCSRIDSISSSLKEQIEVLEKYKKSLIFEAVTKGLDKDAPMKDSGMEFVGKIPKNWNVKKTKYIATNISKGNGITKDQVLKDGNIQCVRYGEIYSKYDGIVVDTKSLTKIEEIDSPKYARYGDILFAGTGELIEEIGKNIVYLGNKPCLVGGDIVVMKHNQNPRFLNYALGSFYAQSQKSKGKAKLKVVHISAEEIGNIKIVLPSLKEQELIADFLDSKCSAIDSAIAGKKEQISILAEYKKSLIYEYVTGKKEIPNS